MGCHAGGRVGRPGDGHLLPGQEEDDTSVTCRRIEETHVVRAVGQEIQEVGLLLLSQVQVVEVAGVAGVTA